MSNKLVVVADARNAMFYKAIGLKIKEQKSQINADDFKIQHDRPLKKDGFFHVRSNPGHFFDPHSEAKGLERADFSKEIIHAINSICNEEHFDELIIAAEPKTLGEIRNNASKRLKEMVLREIPKDLTHATQEEIEAQVFK